MYAHLIYAWDKKSPEEKNLVHCVKVANAVNYRAISLAPDANS